MANHLAPRDGDGSPEHAVYPVEAGLTREAGIGHLGDILTTGDISGSNVAIGRGASIIVYEAQSRIREIRLEEQYISEQVADAIGRQLSQYEQLAHKTIFSTITNPYRTLQSFDIEDAALFFGRQADINALLTHLNNPITILRSSSGAGKSSLLKAGVAARLLAAGHLPVYVRPFQKDPAEALKAWFLYGMEEHPEMERVRRESLVAFMQRILDLLPDPRRLIVVLIDQFEEFFYYLPLEEQQAFISELERCRAQLSRRVRWIFAIRDDKFTELGAFCPPICLSFSDTYHLAWTDAQARETIIEPARQVGLSVDTELPQQIVDDLTINERQLTPLHLQLICHTLFANSDQPSLNLSVALYRSLGAAQGILQSWLQRVLAGLPKEEERDVAQFALRELVDSQFHRIRRTRADLESACMRDLDIDRLDLINVLSYLEANGLVLREDDGDTAEFELTHDFLAEQIELDPNTISRKLALEMLQQDVTVWLNSNRNRNLLLPQGRLAFVVSYLDRSSLPIEAIDILDQSQQQIEDESRIEISRLKAISNRNLAILAIVSIISLILSTRYLVLPYLMRSSTMNDNFAALVPIDGLEGVRFEAYEVTNERFAKCVDWGICDRPNGFQAIRPDPRDDLLWFTDPTWHENRYKPVVGIDAVDALRFCEWIGRTLPTANQWAYTAPDSRTWSALESSSALLCREGDCTVLGTVGDRTVPQYRNKEGEGIYDLVGSVSEWTRTKVDKLADGNYCTDHDHADFESAIEISILGDDFTRLWSDAGTLYNNASGSTSSSDIRAGTIGFRCVESMQPDVGQYSCPSLEKLPGSSGN